MLREAVQDTTAGVVTNIAAPAESVIFDASPRTRGQFSGTNAHSYMRSMNSDSKTTAPKAAKIFACNELIEPRGEESNSRTSVRGRNASKRSDLERRPLVRSGGQGE